MGMTAAMTGMSAAMMAGTMMSMTVRPQPHGTGSLMTTTALPMGVEGPAANPLDPAARGAAAAGRSALNRRWRTCPIPTLRSQLLLLPVPFPALVLRVVPWRQAQASAGAASPRTPHARGSLPLGAAQRSGARRVPQHRPWRLLRARPHTVLASVCLSFDTTLHPPFTRPRPAPAPLRLLQWQAPQPGCPPRSSTAGLHCRGMAAWPRRLWTHAGRGREAVPRGRHPAATAAAAAQQGLTMAATAAAAAAGPPPADSLETVGTHPSP